jgi:hypothetical protein
VWQSLLAEGLVRQVAKHTLDSGRSFLLLHFLPALRALRAFRALVASAPLYQFCRCKCVCRVSFPRTLPLANPSFLCVCAYIFLSPLWEWMYGAGGSCRHGFVVARYENSLLSRDYCSSLRQE